jgi:hypothetical protein
MLFIKDFVKCRIPIVIKGNESVRVEHQHAIVVTDNLKSSGEILFCQVPHSYFQTNETGLCGTNGGKLKDVS